MIFGGCPYCDGSIINYMPEKSPMFAKRTCEHCENEYWLLCSRVSSEAFTIEGFNKEYTVNEETKEVQRRSG